MKLYITGAALILLAIVYLPIVLFGMVKLWKALPARLPIRVGVTVLAAVVAAVIPLWDVGITSIKMARLCAHAGAVVNRSVRADGFLTDVGGVDYLKKGFRYIEVKRGVLVKVYSKSNEQLQVEEFDTSKVPYVPKSRYEFVKEVSGKKIAFSIESDRTIGRDRESGEVLGYAVRYVAYPGWVDRNTVSLIGQTVWACPSDSFQESRLLDQLIAPNK